MPKQAPETAAGFNPFGELLGLTFTEMEQGRSQCQLEVKQALLNPYGVVHGGVISSLADTAMGGALFSTLSGAERCATVEMKVAFLQPATSGVLTCRAQVIHRTRRLGHVEAEVHHGHELIAKASGTFSIFEAKPVAPIDKT